MPIATAATTSPGSSLGACGHDIAARLSCAAQVRLGDCEGCQLIPRLPHVLGDGLTVERPARGGVDSAAKQSTLVPRASLDRVATPTKANDGVGGILATRRTPDGVVGQPPGVRSAVDGGGTSRGESRLRGGASLTPLARKAVP